jgi:hypothetical protein
MFLLLKNKNKNKKNEEEQNKTDRQRQWFNIQSLVCGSLHTNQSNLSSLDNINVGRIQLHNVSIFSEWTGQHLLKQKRTDFHRVEPRVIPGL